MIHQMGYTIFRQSHVAQAELSHQGLSFGQALLAAIPTLINMVRGSHRESWARWDPPAWFVPVESVEIEGPWG